MKNFLTIFLTSAFCILSWAVSAHAATFTAATCNQSDVNALINGPTHVAVDGDVIDIPAGSCTWTSGITVPAGIGITIKGTGIPDSSAGTLGASASCSQTVITHNVAGNYLMSFLLTTNSSPARISCLKIGTGLGSNAITSPLAVAGTCNTSTCSNVRIDNVTFDGNLQGSISNSDTVIVTDNVGGVLDHNTMTATKSGGLWEFVNFSNSAWKGVGNSGDNSFFSANSFGSAQNLYIENNAFTDTFGHQIVPTETESATPRGGWGGGRIVARFNACNGCYVGLANHGTDSAGRSRGGRQHEYYGNTMICNGSCGGGNGVGIRSGNALVWGNSFTTANGGFYNAYLAFATMRIATIWSPPWNQCPGPYDQASPLLCVDQPNRSGGTLLSGSPPSPTGWSNQVIDPSYEFDNAGYNPAGAGQSSEVNRSPGNSTMSGNKDWYTDNSMGTPHPQTSATAPFNGAPSGFVGMGFGLAARRPTTCTTGVGYWATDEGSWNTAGKTYDSNGNTQGRLYVCTATNTWTLYYTPYTYPHPLVSGSPPPPPPPPPPTGSACDLNGDSSTNVSDVQLCANQAIGAVSCTTGDINHDSSCNVIDVQRVVNAALGGTCVTN